MRRFNLFFVFLFTGIFIFSCMDDEIYGTAMYSYKPIDSVQIDTIRPSGEITHIKTFYTKTTNCESFFDYQYEGYMRERNVAIITAQPTEISCEEAAEVASHDLKFMPVEGGLYIFRFWSGNDDNGIPQYIEKEVEIP